MKTIVLKIYTIVDFAFYGCIDFYLHKRREGEKIKVSNFSVEEEETDATVLALFNRMGRHHRMAKRKSIKKIILKVDF